MQCTSNSICIDFVLFILGDQVHLHADLLTRFCSFLNPYLIFVISQNQSIAVDHEQSSCQWLLDLKFCSQLAHPRHCTKSWTVYVTSYEQTSRWCSCGLHSL